MYTFATLFCDVNNLRDIRDSQWAKVRQFKEAVLFADSHSRVPFEASQSKEINTFEKLQYKFLLLPKNLVDPGTKPISFEVKKYLNDLSPD